VQTLHLLLRAELTDSADHADLARGAASVSADLPDGVSPDDIHLEGDHTDLLADLVVLAVTLQERETAAYGPDDPRALLATILLARAMAAADQLPLEVNDVLEMVEVSRDGLEEHAARSPGSVAPVALEIARITHHWVLERMGRDPDY
jgi:hypothetical protein